MSPIRRVRRSAVTGVVIAGLAGSLLHYLLAVCVEAAGVSQYGLGTGRVADWVFVADYWLRFPTWPLYGLLTSQDASLRQEDGLFLIQNLLWAGCVALAYVSFKSMWRRLGPLSHD
jgi:hypothetical protein